MMIIEKKEYLRFVLTLIIVMVNGQLSVVNAQRSVRLDLDRTIKLATDSR